MYEHRLGERHCASQCWSFALQLANALTVYHNYHDSGRRARHFSARDRLKNPLSFRGIDSAADARGIRNALTLHGGSQLAPVIAVGLGSFMIRSDRLSMSGALNGHHGAVTRCILSGDKRTWLRPLRSAKALVRSSLSALRGYDRQRVI